MNLYIDVETLSDWYHEHKSTDHSDEECMEYVDERLEEAFETLKGELREELRERDLQ